MGGILRNEVWKNIEGFPNYKISNLGNIKSFTRKKFGNNLVPQPMRKGYLQVLLYKDGKPYPRKVHRLVAIAFIPNDNNLPQVNHIDGDKTNNCIDNLEWCDNSYNQIHAYKNGLEKPRFQSKVKQYSLDGIFIKQFEYIKDAAKELNIDDSSISACCRKKRKTAGGYIWKYANDNI